MKIIFLTQDKITKVSDWQYDRLMAMGSWLFVDFVSSAYAARKGVNSKTGKRCNILMQNCIKGEPPVGFIWDHIDGDGLNNQDDNLRLATSSQQCQNRHIANNNTSGYKGVSWHVRMQKWGASIGINRKRKHIGYFSTAEEAALAYNRAAVQLFGEFAKLNAVNGETGVSQAPKIEKTTECSDNTSTDSLPVNVARPTGNASKASRPSASRDVVEGFEDLI